MKKERLAAVLLALGLVGAAVPAEAAERNFSDTSGHYAGEVIGVWSGYEVLRGYPDGTFRPDGVITRGELAVVLDRVMGYRAAAENCPKGNGVPKVSSAWRRRGSLRGTRRDG